MHRRSKTVEGWVNFPIENENTDEGGMFVKLIVIDRREFDECYGVCCGAVVTDHNGEVFIGCDTIPRPSGPNWEAVSSLEELDDAFRYEKDAYSKWMSNFFSGEYNEQMYGLLSSTVLGSTGWSGDFICTYDTLTNDGKAFYDLMKKLYPMAELHLLTFLDT